MSMRMVTVKEVLPEAATLALVKFVEEVSAGKITNQPDKTMLRQLKERVLEPWRQELETTCDLDYLAYALACAVQQTLGIQILA